MRPICLVFLVTSGFDSTILFQRAFSEAGAELEVVKLPHFLMGSLKSRRLEAVKAVVRQKSAQNFVIFSPDTTELFLAEADFLILFSAYQSWYRPERMRVIPHLWTPVRMPQRLDPLTWTSKPSPGIGFMGRTHATSRLTSALLLAPKLLKEWLLRGTYLRHPLAIAWLGDLGISLASVNTFPRVETIRILREGIHLHPGLKLDIVEKTQFGGTTQELDSYTRHLCRNTYIICPRGSENYSFRMYEALSLGRVPVIVDTDMVLPPEIDWDQLSIKVPYSELKDIYSFIENDYQNTTERAFIERQRRAFQTMRDLHSFNWIGDLCRGIVSLRVN